MATSRAPFHYAESRLSLDQRFPGSLVQLTLPSSNPSFLATSRPLQRNILQDTQIQRDLSTFEKRHIASEASVFFRSESRSPRAIAWRLLNERNLLELQAVDLTTQGEEDAPVALLLKFPAAVRPFGLAFADASEKDALVVFAITTSDNLYTITVPHQSFVHTKATENVSPDVCRVYAAQALKVDYPYRLTASDENNLFISLSGDSLARLRRTAGQDGTQWQESYYTGTTLMSGITKSVRSRLWSKTESVQFEGIELEPTAAVSVTFSPDRKAILAVCLNHTLRAWNAESGRLTAEASLLSEATRQKVVPNMPPTQRSLIQVSDQLGQPGDQYYIITYVPYEKRFRFWAMLDSEVAMDTLREIHQDLTLTPPVDEILDDSIWILEEFFVVPGKNWQQTALWLRVTSGPVSRVLKLTFNLFDDSHDMEATWKHDWKSVSQGFQNMDILSQAAPLETINDLVSVSAMDLSEKWLDFLLYPGRFSDASLEVALIVYTQKVVGKSKEQSASFSSKASLRDNVNKTVTANASDAEVLRAGANSPLQVLSSQWQAFFSLVKELHKRRGETLSLSFDIEEQLPWVSCADMVAPVRDCADLEAWALNNARSLSDRQLMVSDSTNSQTIQIDGLMGLAFAIRNCLSPAFYEEFMRALNRDALEDPTLALPDRLAALHKSSDTDNGISNEDFEKCLATMEQTDLKNYLSDETIIQLLTVIRGVSADQGSNSEDITTFGKRQLIQATQESIALNIRVITDTILLIMLVYCELDADDVKGMPTAFDENEAFYLLIEQLKQQLTLDFLTKKFRNQARPTRRRASSIEIDSPSKSRDAMSDNSEGQKISTTLLESMFMAGWTRLHTREDLSMGQLLTAWPRLWITSFDLTTRFEDFTAHALADLIKRGDYKLAHEFLTFVPLTSWSSYLKGRLYVMTGDCKKAAPCFKDCAIALALGSFDVNEADTAELVDLYDRESFTVGLAAYYQHVLTIFANVKAHTYAAEFATLALEALHQDPSSEDPRLEEELASRLFTASLAISHFDEAYGALSHITSPALRKANLQTFMQALINQNRNDLLLAYPYTTLATEADAVLASLASKNTAQLATKYHNILYFFRMHRGNIKGAAQAAFSRLRHLQGLLEADDPKIREAYLITINALACVDPNEAWVISEPGTTVIVESHRGTGKPISFAEVSGEQKSAAREVLTIADLRLEYQGELDRISDLETGRFAYEGSGDGDRMDVL